MSPSQSQELKQRALDLEAQAEDSTKSEAEIGRLALEAAKLHFQLAKDLNEPPDPTRGNLPDPNSHINRAFLLIKRAKSMAAHGQFKWSPEAQRLQDEIDELYYRNLKAQPMLGSQIGQTEDYERIQRIKDKGIPESLLGGKTMKSVIVRIAEDKPKGSMEKKEIETGGKVKSPWAVCYKSLGLDHKPDPDSEIGKKFERCVMDVKKQSSSQWSITKRSSTPWSITKEAQNLTPSAVPTAPSAPAPTATGEQVMAEPAAEKPIGGMVLMTSDGKPMGNTATLADAQKKAQEVFLAHPEILSLNIVGPDGMVVEPVARTK